MSRVRLVAAPLWGLILRLRRGKVWGILRSRRGVLEGYCPLGRAVVVLSVGLVESAASVLVVTQLLGSGGGGGGLPVKLGQPSRPGMPMVGCTQNGALFVASVDKEKIY